MSAKILQFVPRARHGREPIEARKEFHSPIHANDLVMDHADTASCEYFPWRELRSDDESA